MTAYLPLVGYVIIAGGLASLLLDGVLYLRRRRRRAAVSYEGLVCRASAYADRYRGLRPNPVWARLILMREFDVWERPKAA